MTHCAAPSQPAGSADEELVCRRLNDDQVAIEDTHILIVDDQEPTLLLMARQLERAGFSHVTTASSGRVALAIMREDAPDVLVLDVHMPELDGIETLQSMFTDGPAQHAVSVIAVSGDSTFQTRREMILCGADEYLVRPLTAAQFIDAVRRMATRTRALNRALARVSVALDKVLYREPGRVVCVRRTLGPR
jgi:putative two-component system response regulator